ncbi:MAG: magnesium transporter CorA family protein [Egibacteraceae bacterium]
MTATITIRRIAGGRVEVLELAALDTALAESDGFVWIDLVGRDGQGEAVLRLLGMRDPQIEDLLEEAIHPKAEVGDGHLLTVVHGLDLDYAQEQAEFEIETIELDGVVGPNWVLTHADRALQVTRQVAALVERDPSAVPTPCALLHRMLDTIVDEYEPFLEQFIPERIDAIEEELFDDRPSAIVRREIYLRRHDVMRIQRVAIPQASAMRELVRLAKTCEFACDDAPLFRDIADRLDRVASLTATLRAELDSAFEHYFSAVATNQNEVMKILTMVAAILLPLTVVTGIYGMNFEYMPELDERWAYPAVLALNAAIVVIVLLFFRARGWIGRRRAEPTRKPLEIPVLGQVLRLPALGGRAVGEVTRRAARLALRGRARYHHAERR